MVRRPQGTPLFPYTTLFRSSSRMRSGPMTGGRRSAGPPTHGLLELDRHVPGAQRSEEHTSELQSQSNLVCRLLLEKKNCMRHLSKRINLHSTVYATDLCILE